MRPALRTHRSPAHLLQVIVAHRRRGPQRSGNVVFVNDVPLFSAVPPNSGKAIRLQLEINRKRILLALILR